MDAESDFDDLRVVTSQPVRQQYGGDKWNLQFDPSARYLGCRINDARLAKGRLQYAVTFARVVPERLSHDSSPCGTVWVDQSRIAPLFHIFPGQWAKALSTMGWRPVIMRFYSNPQDTNCFLGDGFVELKDGNRKLVRHLARGDILTSGACIRVCVFGLSNRENR